MEKKKHQKHQESNETNETPERRSKARRRLLQSLAAGSAVVTVKTLPERWTKPILNDALLPAHAQVSPSTCELQCEITSAQETDESVGDDINVNGLGNALINIDKIVDINAFSFNQITATLNDDCPADDIDLQVSLDIDIFGPDANLAGGAQDRPLVGGVATFSEVSVFLSDPLGGDVVSNEPVVFAGDLRFVFSAAGADDCVINVSFEETSVPPPGP